MKKQVEADKVRRAKLAADGVDRGSAAATQRGLVTERGDVQQAKREAKGEGKRGGVLSDEQVREGSKTCSPPKPESASSTLNLAEYTSGSGRDNRFGDKCNKSVLGKELAARDVDPGRLDGKGVPIAKAEVLLGQLAVAAGFSVAALKAAEVAKPRTPMRIDKMVSLDRPKLDWRD